jgi:hypothetical protein
MIAPTTANTPKENMVFSTPTPNGFKDPSLSNITEGRDTTMSSILSI